MPKTRRIATLVSTGDKAGEAREAANYSKRRRTTEGTKNTYNAKIAHFAAWCSENNYLEAVDDEGTVKTPFIKEAIIDFFGNLSRPAYRRAELAGPEELTAETAVEPYNFDTLDGYRSALMSLYTDRGLRLEESLEADWKTLLTGYKNVTNDLKKIGLMKITTGKREFKMDGYILLARKFMTYEPPDRQGSFDTAVFAWAYFVLMWNLIARPELIDDLILARIMWKNDCLCIFDQGGKGDQSGAHSFGKHVYANPMQPEICPVLALSVYVLCCGGRSAHTVLLFSNGSHDRFAHILGQVVKRLSPEELRVLGLTPKDIGPYSLRKGSATYCLGQTTGPNPVSVVLRMGHTLGKVNDPYLHFSDGADMLTGRTVAGLPLLDENFAVLPPHFCVPVNESRFTEEFWASVIPLVATFPIEFKMCLDKFVASALFHEAFLRSVLPAGHTFFTIRLFSQNDRLSELRGLVCTGIGKCNISGMTATGIPPHVMQAQKIRLLQEKLDAMVSKFDTAITTIEQTIPELVSDLVVSKMRENFVVEGVAPITTKDFDNFKEDINRFFVNTRSDALQDFRTEYQRMEEERRGPSEPMRAGDSVSPFKLYYWGDGLVGHHVPQNFRFPKKIPMLTLWNLWQCGHQDDEIGPYKFISRQYDLTGMGPKKLFTAASRIMTEIEQIMLHSEPPMISNIADLKVMGARGDAIFEEAFKCLLVDLYDGNVSRCKRPAAVTCGTLYNLLLKSDKKKELTMDEEEEGELDEGTS